MDARAFTMACLAVLLPFPSVASGQETYRFDLSLVSAEFPDLDTSSVIDGEVGEEFIFTAELLIISSDVTDGEGAQGWSLGVRHSGLEVVSLTTEGTISAPLVDGGLRDDEEYSFIQYEVVDPSRNEGKEGVVQAVLLSYRSLASVPPNTVQVVGKNVYRARIEIGGRVTFVRFEDDLEGSGQPVENVVTVRSQSEFPTLGSRDIIIGGEPSAEVGNCDDGVDNDEDGQIDCEDPDCRTAAVCGAEVCDDGVDNDGDSAVDCDDEDCRGQLICRENCQDGEDNDSDGMVDCEDLDCQTSPDCRERCTDGIDNDLDGHIDCDDSECASLQVCRDPEECEDGLDNDLDGRTDCDDPDCYGVGECPSPEVCGDGEDNDQDGFTDCDDLDCIPLALCNTPEDCGDGIDNDLDGRVDCDDVECLGSPACPVAEICDNGVDDDGDGLVDCEDPICEVEDPCGAVPGGFDLVLHAYDARRERVEAKSTQYREINVLEVPNVEGYPIEVVTYIVPFPEPQETGAQGWSIAVGHDKEIMEIDSEGGGPTIEGTDAAELLSGGFEVTETARDSEKDDEADGYISAVVLSFANPVSLNPTRPQSVARARYRLKASGGAKAVSQGAVGFQDGLQGAGQPVSNTLTISGSSVPPVHLVPLEVRATGSQSLFIRGDVNDDGKLDIGDAIWCVNELVRGGAPTLCRQAADINLDDLYNLSDPIYLVQYYFLHGPSIPAPFPECGVSPVPSSFTCPVDSVSACR